jgi:S-formylglutathione hydrolase FrmB
MGEGVTSWLAELSLTDWWPARVTLVVLLVVVIAVAVFWARRWYLRTVLGLVVLVMVAANVLAGVNAYYGYYLTLGQAIGLRGGDEVSLAQLNRRTRPADGLVVAVDIPASASHFAARPAEIYLPPAWFARPRPRLPVLVLLHGTPGSPHSWLYGGAVTQTLDAWAATHAGRTPIVVMPDINGSLFADTECVDSPIGNAETYLTVDLPAFVHRRFFTLPAGRSWGVGGFSEGGECSVMLALRHPTLFGTFVDFSGVVGPRVGSTNAMGDTLAVLFHGSQQDFDDHEPAYLLTRRQYHRSVAGWFAVGGKDGAPVGAARYLAWLGPRAGVPTHLLIAPGQNHTFYFWSEAFAGLLPWLVARLAPATGGHVVRLAGRAHHHAHHRAG